MDQDEYFHDDDVCTKDGCACNCDECLAGECEGE